MGAPSLLFLHEFIMRPDNALSLFFLSSFPPLVTVVEESEVLGPLDTRLRKSPAELDKGLIAHQAARFDSGVRPG